MSSPENPACSGDMYSSVPTTAPELRGQRFIRQLAGGRLGHSEVDDLGHRLAVDQRDQDVGRLQVTMDDALLMGVLHRLADRHEELEALIRS